MRQQRIIISISLGLYALICATLHAQETPRGEERREVPNAISDRLSDLEWTTDAAQVRSEEASGQRLSFDGGGWSSAPLPAPSEKGVAFYQFKLTGFPAKLMDDGMRIDIYGAVLGYKLIREAGGPRVGELMTLDVSSDGRTRNWRRTGIHIALNEAGELTGGPRLTVRIDRVHGVWDLYMNKRMFMADLGLDLQAAESRVAIAPGKNGRALLMSLHVSDDNPHYEDLNLNGVPDSFEANQGFATNEDRNNPVSDGGKPLIDRFVRKRLNGH